MKRSRAAVASIVICLAAVWATFEYSHAAPATTSGMNIGVVSIQTVITQSAHQVKYRNALMTRESQLRAQLESRAKDIEAAEAELNTMVPGSEDYLKQLQVVLNKRAALDSEQEYLKQKRSLENKEWMEKLYQATLKIVAELAQEKGFALVLERTEPKFPISADELMATFSTHKILYSGSCPDLTDEVLRRLDAMDSLKP
ncbi:MAG: OmpH family outer membrane protein [Sedimentisphaerales bacterium]|nr:OmpH family outer membrane protein [Sedimentisphaerales bacterium]